jgi:ParB family chromosome partitioning protein
MSKRALGKGIGALLGEEGKGEPANPMEVPISSLKPSPYQPRQEFSEETLGELADSIREKGVLQPILVEAGSEGEYLIVAGERRVRAARLAGLRSIPVIVRQLTPQERLEVALIENVQREDLTPIEQANAYRSLMEMAGLSQEQLSQRVGKERSTVANTLRLLRLPDEAKEAINSGAISAGHARALLALTNPADVLVLMKRIVDRGLSVREAEDAAGALNKGKKGRSAGPSRETTQRGDPHTREMQQALLEKLGTKVEIRGTAKKGKIEIFYFSADELERLLKLLT